MTAAIAVGTATGRWDTVAAARFRPSAAGVRTRMRPGVALADVSGGGCAVTVLATGSAGDARGAAELHARWTRVFAGVADRIALRDLTGDGGAVVVDAARETPGATTFARLADEVTGLAVAGRAAACGRGARRASGAA
jgi:hypothetical protein